MNASLINVVISKTSEESFNWEEKHMKRIKINHNDNDRIICVTEDGKHSFYYQPFGKKNRLWLFDTKNFSGSVFAFFRKHGRTNDGIGFSMTVKEFYKIENNQNVKIRKIMERIPVQVEYVLREFDENGSSYLAA